VNGFGLTNVELRTERPADYCAAENMTREAFWNFYSPGCNEHYLLHIMRDCSAFVPELDIVAVHDGKIIGNIIYTKAVIAGDDGVEHGVLGMGPIAVLPEYQNKGVGGKLIAYTKNLARDMGYPAILLYGDPDYYCRHGFVPAEQFGIRTADNMYAVAHQVCELRENVMSCITGRYIEDAVYELDETAAAEFDKVFAQKERILGTLSQKRFEQLVSMRKPAA